MDERADIYMQCNACRFDFHEACPACDLKALFDTEDTELIRSFPYLLDDPNRAFWCSLQDPEYTPEEKDLCRNCDGTYCISCNNSKSDANHIPDVAGKVPCANDCDDCWNNDDCGECEG